MSIEQFAAFFHRLVDAAPALLHEVPAELARAGEHRGGDAAPLGRGLGEAHGPQVRS